MQQNVTSREISSKRTNSKSPFVVDISASLLKKNSQLGLSKQARVLYSTMRALADGKTGALKIKDRWLKAKAIDAAAVMCRDVRMVAMRELQALGLVTIDRERVMRVIKGRKRKVFGIARYFVHRQPINEKNLINKPFLLKSVSSTVEEIDSQVLSNPPFGVEYQGEVVVPGSDSKDVYGKNQNHHRKDDDASVSLSRLEKLLVKAKTFLVNKDEDPEFVEAALEFIEERSEMCGGTPASAKYYIASFETLKHSSEDMAEIWEIVNRKRELREKWMPGFTGELSTESEQRRRQFNAKHGLAEAKSDALVTNGAPNS
jgi:hypothetical protein